ncbi:hypothetical protein RB594_008246 [Gaeumannomyces avenae]
MAMNGLQKRTAKATSAGIRLASYFFLRWALLPIIPVIVFSLFALYAPAFIAGYGNELIRQELEEERELFLRETTITSPPTVEAQNGKATIKAEEVTIQETLVVPKRHDESMLRTLVSGVPNPRTLVSSSLTFLINLACVVMVGDRLFRDRLTNVDDLSFVRLGHVSHLEAKLLIREPDQSRLPITFELKIKNPKPPFDNPLWEKVGGVRWTTDETDYTAVLTIPLKHSKQRTYEWRASNNQTGEFTSAPKPGQSPEQFDGKFTFLSTSCIVHRLPYDPRDTALAIPGMRYLANVLPTLGAQFMLFLGDFIYIDVPRRWGSSADVYRKSYRQVYASPEWATVGQNLSWIHVIDDHEIANDWDANTTGVYNAAMDPWKHYLAEANPPLARQAGLEGAATTAREGASYFEFTQGPASFFMLDTRSYRSGNKALPADSPEKTMLGADQLEDLLAFLARPEPRGVRWKVVASSVPLTKNWRVNTQDTWGGFLAERRRILEAMWDAGASLGVGVIVLSGDRHEFAATRFPPPPGDRWPESAAVHEFSVSPLSQFYSPIPTYRQTDDEDVQLKYINKGNSKFGAITMENLAGSDQGSLRYRLFIDGVETWDTVLVTPPAPPKQKAQGIWGFF